MRYPTKPEFRTLALVGAALVLASGVMEHFQIPEPSEDVKNALQWNYYDAAISHEALVAVYYLIVFGWIVGVIALSCFWGIGRWILLGTYGLQIILGAGFGLHVVTGLSNALSSLGTIILFLPLYLSFFPPCEGYFRKQNR